MKRFPALFLGALILLSGIACSDNPPTPTRSDAAATVGAIGPGTRSQVLELLEETLLDPEDLGADWEQYFSATTLDDVILVPDDATGCAAGDLPIEVDADLKPLLELVAFRELQRIDLDAAAAETQPLIVSQYVAYAPAPFSLASLPDMDGCEWEDDPGEGPAFRWKVESRPAPELGDDALAYRVTGTAGRISVAGDVTYVLDGVAFLAIAVVGANPSGEFTGDEVTRQAAGQVAAVAGELRDAVMPFAP